VLIVKEYYAHSLEGKQPAEWHRLEDHLPSPQSSPWQGEVEGVKRPNVGMAGGVGVR